MKSIRQVAALTAVLALALSCSTDPMDYDQSYSVELDGSYIETYYDGPLQCVLCLSEAGLPCLAVSLDTEVPELIRRYSLYSPSAEDASQYNLLCDKHRDHCFQGKDALFDSPAKICYAHDITSIELTCESKFDSDHPAGTSLMDIMAYSANSFGPFIYGGYKWDMSNYQVALSTIAVSTEPGAAIPSEYLALLSYSDMFRLYFTKTPSEPGEYKMNLTVTLDDGQVKTFKINYLREAL